MSHSRAGDRVPRNRPVNKNKSYTPVPQKQMSQHSTTQLCGLNNNLSTVTGRLNVTFLVLRSLSKHFVLAEKSTLWCWPQKFCRQTRARSFDRNLNLERRQPVAGALRAWLRSGLWGLTLWEAWMVACTLLTVLSKLCAVLSLWSDTTGWHYDFDA